MAPASPDACPPLLPAFKCLQEQCAPRLPIVLCTSTTYRSSSIPADSHAQGKSIHEHMTSYKLEGMSCLALMPAIATDGLPARLITSV